jgi:hypothetical protein
MDGMNQIGAHMAKMQPPLLEDPDDTKYTTVLHGLCKKYDVKDPLGKHIFSIIENMSRRGRPCLYTLETLAKFSGGSESDIEAILQHLESIDAVARTKLKKTDGWKLADDARKYANWLKQNIGLLAKESKKHT